MSVRLTSLATAFALLTLPACYNSVGVDYPDPILAGVYTATVFTVTNNGEVTDHIALGTTLNITLNANGTTTGSLVALGIPLSMNGTWNAANAVVRFDDQPQETFMISMPFEVVGNQLRGLLTVDGVTIRLVLTRTGLSP